MTNKEKSIAFSNGEFKSVYEFISDNAVWIIIEDVIYKDKNEIIFNCQKVQSYFNTITTNFEITNVIEELNHVVVNGTAEFLHNGKITSLIHASDHYEFNAIGQIQKITSYCIKKKYN